MNEGSGGFWVDQAVMLPVDHVDGLDPDLAERCRWFAPPMRGPGGNFVSGHHFWHGLGPGIAARLSHRIGNGIDDNSFGVDEFLRL
ncbi:MAG: hypothetical protein R2856_10910 [Caldilineaceae bacterium]